MTDIVEKLKDPLKPQGELRPLCIEAAGEIERLRNYVDFVRLWCTRQNVTDTERLSVILHHPTAQSRSRLNAQ